MQRAIRDWFQLYYAEEAGPEEDPCQRIPCAVVSKLQKACFAEYEAEVSLGEARARSWRGARRSWTGSGKDDAACDDRREAWLKPVPGKGRFYWSVVRRDAVAVLGRDRAAG